MSPHPRSRPRARYMDDPVQGAALKTDQVPRSNSKNDYQVDSRSTDDATCHIHVAVPPGEQRRHVAEGVRPGALLSHRGYTVRAGSVLEAVPVLLSLACLLPTHYLLTYTPF